MEDGILQQIAAAYDLPAIIIISLLKGRGKLFT